MKIKLTNKNYFTGANNRGLSSSKIKDYLYDPYYFYQKHILFQIKEEKSDAFIIGSAVDTILTLSKQKFNKEYKVVTRRNIQNPPTNYTELTQTQFEEIIKIAESVKKQDAYRELKDHQRQVVLTLKDKVGEHFDYICGMLDFLQIKKNKATITDLKTSNTIDPRKYAFAAEEYGYYLSAAMYQTLVLYNYPEVEEVEFRHLVVEKDKKEIYPVQTFILSQKNIELASQEMEMVIDEIRNMKEYKPRNIGWKDAIKI